MKEMITTSCKNKEELQKKYESMLQRYEALKLEGLKLDMSRARPKYSATPAQTPATIRG